MKRFLLAITVLVGIFGVTTLEQWFLMTPAARAQVNTFCAANLACTVTGAWTFNNVTGLTVNGTLSANNVTNLQLTAASKIWIDVTASPYGAVGDGVTDNSAAVQLAVNAVPTGVNAGSRIFFPCGTFRFKANAITWPVNTPIELIGAGPCSIIQKDFDSTAQSGNPTSVFYSPQSYGTSTTLSANANRGDQQLTVTSSGGFVAGGWIQLNDNTGFTGFNCITYQTWEPAIASCNLELQQIDSVPDGTHINLKTSLDNNYTTAGSSTVKAITPVYARVHDLKFSAAGPDCAIPNACGGRFFDLSMVIESEWHNNIFDVPLSAGIQIHRGKHFKILDNAFRNGDNSQTQNGLLAIPFLSDEGSSYWSFANNNIYKLGQVAIDSQSHHASVISNTFHGCGDDCINTHGHLDHDINISNNIMGGFPSSNANGTVAGRCVVVSDTDFNLQINNNTCSTFSSIGIQVQSASQGGIFNIQVLNNSLVNPVTSGGTFPPNWLASTASGIVGISIVRVDNAKVSNNTIYGSFPTSSTGLNLQGLRQSEVIGNHIIQTNTTGPPTGDTGLFVNSISLGAIAHVVIAANTVTGWHNNNCQFFVSSLTIDTVTFANNSCFSGPGGNYSYAAGATNFIRDNNEGDTQNNFLAGFLIPEAAAIAGLANSDVLYPDSTAHRWKMNNNNGGATNVVGSSDITLTLKKGSGAGNYTNATTSYTVADSTNLCLTVTIPAGFKLGISASGALATATAAVVAQAALTDNAACATANAGILVETAPVQGAAIAVADAFALNWVITGDGAAHNIALQFKTSNAADTASLINSSATITPTIRFELMPSN